MCLKVCIKLPINKNNNKKVTIKNQQNNFSQFIHKMSGCFGIKRTKANNNHTKKSWLKLLGFFMNEYMLVESTKCM